MRQRFTVLSGLLVMAAMLPGAAQERALKSGIDVGAEVKSFSPEHVAGPNRGTRTCPVC